MIGAQGSLYRSGDKQVFGRGQSFLAGIMERETWDKDTRFGVGASLYLGIGLGISLDFNASKFLREMDW